MSGERKPVHVGPFEPVIAAGVEVPPGASGRADFFDGEMTFLGSCSIQAGGGTITAWPGSSWWRAVREAEQ